MTYVAEVLADSPLAYYRLEESSGTTLSDATTNARHGIFENVGNLTYGLASLLASEPTAKAIRFNSSGRGKVTYASWMDAPAAELSVEVWINVTSLTGVQTIVNRRGTFGNVFQMRLNAGKPEFLIWTTVGLYTVTAPSQLSLGVHHVVFTSAPNNGGNPIYARIYVDGSQVVQAQTVGTVATSGTPALWIGYNDQFDAEYPQNMTIDELALYGTTLSAVRVAAHYAAAIAAPGGGSPVTLLQDDFDRANSTTAPGTPTVGGPYTASAGTWGILSNQLYLSASILGYLLAPGASDVDFTVTLPLANAGSAGPHSGLVWRALDASNHLSTIRSATGTFAIQRVVAGVSTVISQEFPSVANDVHRVLCYGRMMWFLVNGKVVWSQEDTRYDPTNNTKIGFRNGATTSGRWDNALAVSVTSPPPVPFTWGEAPEAADGIDVNFPGEFAVTPSLYKGRDTAIADESEIP